jgi:DNA mismatch endonuclease (patch repair protein)
MPKSKLEFWRPKLEGNRQRDLRTRSELEQRGWSVFEVWECQTGRDELDALAISIKRAPLAPQSGRGNSRK